MSVAEKKHNGQDKTITYTRKPDDIDPYDDPDVLRAQLSCGHAVSPHTLTDYCRSQLDQGKNTFICPALKLPSNTSCGAVWSYAEVQKLALLTLEEKQYFEETLAMITAKKSIDFKSCPLCNSFVERKNPSNLNVRCTYCSATSGAPYEFCWQCLSQWKGPSPRTECCDNEGCNKQLLLLKTCSDVTLTAVKVQCPAVRACPTCGLLIEHNTEQCKNVTCIRCNVEFCFVCLKQTKLCLTTSRHYTECSDGVAPRQTSIPVWSQNGCKN